MSDLVAELDECLSVLRQVYECECESDFPEDDELLTAVWQTVELTTVALNELADCHGLLAALAEEQTRQRKAGGGVAGLDPGRPPLLVG